MLLKYLLYSNTVCNSLKKKINYHLSGRDLFYSAQKSKKNENIYQLLATRYFTQPTLVIVLCR